MNYTDRVSFSCVVMTHSKLVTLVRGFFVSFSLRYIYIDYHKNGMILYRTFFLYSI